MTAVFNKTAKSSATQSFVHAAVATLVGCLFIAIAVFVIDLPAVAGVLLPIIGLLSLIWAVGLARTGAKYLSSGMGWRVEVTEQSLSWQSPLEQVMASFDVPLSNIRTLRHVSTRRSGKGVGYRNDFTIELVEGNTIKISENVRGIDPGLVFEALEAEGVSIVREVYHTKAEIRKKHEKKLDNKRAMRAKRRSESTENLTH